MSEDNTMMLSIDFEHFLADIFGKQHAHQLSGTFDMPLLKKEYIHIFDSLKKHIRINLDKTDCNHFKELISLCDEAKDEINSAEFIDKVNESAFIFMTKLAFLLMGRMPNNWEKKVLNHNNHYRLDQYRSVTYSQSVEQKVNLVLDSFSEYHEEAMKIPVYQQYTESSHHHPPELARYFIEDKLFKEFNKNQYKFIEWFKDNFKNIYMSIFFNNATFY